MSRSLRSLIALSATLWLFACASVRQDELGGGAAAPSGSAPPAAAAARSALPVADATSWGSAELALAAPKLDSLAGTLWLRTSVEYEAVSLQAYAAARSALDQALADPSWTAALEQASDPERARKPPAIILDVDETVLDNSAYQVRLIRDGRRYDWDSWHAWCREARATPIPGALAFTQYAASRGVTVFYVTNRQALVTEGTIENLRREGFPLANGKQVVLTRGLKEEWGSDKGTRRAEIARGYRILLLVGDDLGDFLSNARVSVPERRAAAEAHRERWGRQWIVLPNPVYGSWWDSLFGFDFALGEEQKLERRMEALGE